MRTVPHARYYLPPKPWAGPRAKPYDSNYLMTAEEAAKLGAVGMVPGTERMIEVAETLDESMARAHTITHGAREPGDPE